MIDKLHNIELNFLQQLLQYRTDYLDYFFKFLGFFDTIYFYIVLICLVWAIYWRWGIRLFFIIAATVIVNGLLKNLFMMPRPCDIDPSLGLIKVTGSGFPSGAAQTTLLLALLFITSFKDLKKVWIVSLGFAFLIGISRVYLGVHFISDVFGGWIFAMILFIFYLLLIEPFEKLLFKMNYFTIFLMIEAVSFLLLLLPLNVKWEYPYYSMGIGLGYLLSSQFNMFLEKSGNGKEIIIKTAISILAVYGLFKTYLVFFHNYSIYIAASILIGVWIAFITSFIYKLFIMKYINKGTSL